MGSYFKVPFAEEARAVLTEIFRSLPGTTILLSLKKARWASILSAIEKAKEKKPKCLYPVDDKGRRIMLNLDHIRDKR